MDEERNPRISPVCGLCVYLDVDALADGGIARCAAFLEIPQEIWSGENDHTFPFPGDGGILFFEGDMTTSLDEDGRVTVDGDPLAPWPDQDVQLTEDDAETAVLWWRDLAPEGAEGLLDALSDG